MVFKRGLEAKKHWLAAQQPGTGRQSRCWLASNVSTEKKQQAA
jgi:hypothetical protein